MAVQGARIEGPVEDIGGLTFGLVVGEVLYPFKVSDEALQDAAATSREDYLANRTEIFWNHQAAIIRAALRFVGRDAPAEQILITSELLRVA